MTLPARRIGTLALALAGAGVFHLLGCRCPFCSGRWWPACWQRLPGRRCGDGRGFDRRAHDPWGGGRRVDHARCDGPRAADGGQRRAGADLCGPDRRWSGFRSFRRMGFDPATAWYAAMPGGLADMVTFGQEAGADVRALSLIQATRVLIIVLAAPLDPDRALRRQS
jgi:uncharacterized protein